tara:strand:- start:170 stop:961 length:792 start_codon:yes stop_codon:yes gene_type:complete
MIMGQQGPQIASIFGTGGAVVGAFIAFGSILAGLVYTQLTGTGQSMKDLAEDAKGLRDAFDDLGPAARAYQRALAAKEIEEAEKNIGSLNEKVRRGRKTVSEGFMANKEYTESLEDWTLRELLLGQQLERQKHIIKVKKEQVDDLTTVTEKFIDKLKEEKRVTGQSALDIAISSEAYKKATKVQRERIIALVVANETQKHNLKLTKEETALDKKAAEEKAAFIANLDKQHNLMKLTGEDLYIYQANLAGATILTVTLLLQKSD